MELPELIASLAARPGPVLTWYGESRTELGGGVAARWLAKTANLLAGDLAGDLFGGVPAAPSAPPVAGGERAEPVEEPVGLLRMDLGSSWQGVIWTCAAWLSGWRTLGPALPGTDQVDPDVWVVDSAEEAGDALAQGTPWVLVQAMGPLAVSWTGTLPEGALDALAELAAQSDALEVSPVVSPRTVVCERAATRGSETPLLRRDLDRRVAQLIAGNVDRGPRRVLLTSLDPIEDTLTVLAHWAAGHSVVLVDGGSATARDLNRIAARERAMRV